MEDIVVARTVGRLGGNVEGIASRAWRAASALSFRRGALLFKPLTRPQRHFLCDLFVLARPSRPLTKELSCSLDSLSLAGEKEDAAKRNSGLG